MESGAFNRLDERVVSVTYLEDAFEDPNAPSVDPSTSPGASDGTLPAWAFITIGAAGVFTLLGLLGFVRMRRRRMDKGSDEMTPSGEHVVNDLPPPASELEKPYYDQEPLSQDSRELPQDYTHPTGEDDDDDSTEPLPQDCTPPSGEDNHEDSTKPLPQDGSPPPDEDDDDDSTEPLPQDCTPPSGEDNHEDSTEPLPQGDTPSPGADDDADNTLIVN
jgi:hypothetical protein